MLNKYVKVSRNGEVSKTGDAKISYVAMLDVRMWIVSGGPVI